MSHLRLRKFNNRQWFPGQDIGNDACMAVRAGNHIFLRGQTGFDLEGKFQGVDDAKTQAETAMRNVDQLLMEVGARLEDVCKVTVYITDRAHRTPVYQVLQTWFEGIFPCYTGLIVKGLALPEMLVEIDVDAVIPEENAPPPASNKELRR